MDGQPPQSWGDWLRLTRLLWSGRIAFAAEVERRAKAPREDVVAAADAGGRYTTSIDNHIAALQDPDVFYQMTLLQSWALLERHAKLAKHIVETEHWSLLSLSANDAAHAFVTAATLVGGVDVWGERLMRDVGQSWDQVFGGKVGLVEVSIMRNAIAHGLEHMPCEMLENARNRGASLPLLAGDPIRLTFDQLHEYRGRIRSFCRIIGDGIVHRARGTHWQAD